MVDQEWIKSRIKEVTHLTSQNSGANSDYARGALVGFVAGLVAMGYSGATAINEVIQSLPPDFSRYSLPETWTHESHRALLEGVNLRYVASYKELIESLPEELADKIMEKLLIRYHHVMHIFSSYVKNAKNPHVALNKFEGDGTMEGEYIAFWEVRDLNKPIKDTYNFHGQNTSQWVYAGCIRVCGDSVSIHT